MVIACKIMHCRNYWKKFGYCVDTINNNSVNLKSFYRFDELYKVKNVKRFYFNKNYKVKFLNHLLLHDIIREYNMKKFSDKYITAVRYSDFIAVIERIIILLLVVIKFGILNIRI